MTMGKEQKNSVEEPAALTYGMSAEEDADQKLFEDISDDTQPYTMEELNARIDEAEVEIENGGGKSFKEMMDGFKQELLFR